MKQSSWQQFKISYCKQAVEAGLEDVYPDAASQSVFSAAIAEPLKAVEKQFAT